MKSCWICKSRPRASVEDCRICGDCRARLRESRCKSERCMASAGHGAIGVLCQAHSILFDAVLKHRQQSEPDGADPVRIELWPLLHRIRQLLADGPLTGEELMQVLELEREPVQAALKLGIEKGEIRA